MKKIILKKRIITFLLAAIMVVTVSACGGAQAPANNGGAAAQPAEQAGEAGDTGDSGEAAAAGGDEIRAVCASSPETIDPNLNSSVDGAIYITHLFEGLMRYNWAGDGVEPGVAESYTVSDDGLVWTFKLRSDAKWSDGKPVTAGDFEYSWKRLVNPETAAPYALDMGGFILNATDIIDGKKPVDELGVKVIDDTTFEVTLAGPCGFFEEIVAFPVMSPIRQDTIEANGDKWTREPSTYITNGAFKMESFNLDQNLIVVPDENYYDRDKIKPSRIVFQFLADEIAELTAFQAGEVHWAEHSPAEEKAALESQGVLGFIPQLGTYYLSYNCEVAPMDNINVRKALALAIDREYLANVVLNGSMYPAEAFVGNGFADVDGKDFRDVGGAYMPNNDYEANKDAARAALAEAGYPNGEGFPKLQYMYNNSTMHQSVGEAIQHMWKEVLNIDVEMDIQEWNVFLDTRRKGNYQIARNGWVGDFNDPMTLLMLLQTGSGNNDGNYSNPQYDEYLNISMTSTDRAARMDAMHKAEALAIQEEWAVAPLMYYADEYLAAPELKGWTIIPLGYKFFHTAYLEK